MKRITRVIMCALLIVCILVPTAFAASKTYKGTNSVTYTITTGKKDATLTITGKTGQYAQKFVSYNGKKTKEVKAKGYGVFSVTVDGNTKTVSNKKVSFQLKAGKTYKVTVTYTGFYGFNKILLKLGYKATGNQYWKKNPSVSVSVNGGAKIK